LEISIEFKKKKEVEIKDFTLFISHSFFLFPQYYLSFKIKNTQGFLLLHDSSIFFSFNHLRLEGSLALYHQLT